MKDLKILKTKSLNILLILTTFSFLTSHSTSFAAPLKNGQCTDFSGIFIGLSGGGTHGSAKYLRYRQGGLFGNIPTHDSITDSGLIIGGQAYISQTYSKIYNFGLEVWANQSFTNLRTTDDIFFQESLSYKIKQSFGMAARLGIVTGPALFYIKPGILFSKADIFSKFSAILDNNGFPIPSYTSKRYMPGFSLGIGSDIAITNSQFTVGGEVTVTQYRSFNHIHPMPSGIPGDIKIRFKPKTFTFIVKLNYKLSSFN